MVSNRKEVWNQDHTLRSAITYSVVWFYQELARRVFSGKTGWQGQTGWLVGYLEQNDDDYFFATTVAIMKDEDSRAREAVTRAVFKHLGLL